jgi:putative heme iron utilization protein
MKLPIAILLSLSAATAFADTPRVCANKDEAARIAPALAKGPVGPVTSAALAAELGLNEALIVSTYKPEQAVGVSGASFPQVWGSLNGWGESMILITKGGNVFEVTSKVPPGEPSKRSKYFNLKGSGAGLSGHLRPDLITAIYGFALPTKDGATRGVMFFGENADSVYGVFVASEGRQPSADEMAKFQATWDLLKSLPALCAGAAH